MRVLCADADSSVLKKTVKICEEMPYIDEVYCASDGKELSTFLKKNAPEIIIADTSFGMDVYKKIKKEHPESALILLAEDASDALEALYIHVSGFVLKPLEKRRLVAELEYASTHLKPVEDHIRFRTFGNFDLFVDGEIIVFARSRAKELLAYLVDRQGAGVTRSEAFSAMWEDEEYDRRMQKQFDVVVRSMKQTLEEAGVSDVLEMKRGTLRILPEKVNCDMYRFLEGDEEVIRSYRGEYMSAYPWAEMTEAYLDQSRIIGL